jgi:hypothetical protein
MDDDKKPQITLGQRLRIQQKNIRNEIYHWLEKTIKLIDVIDEDEMKLSIVLPEKFEKYQNLVKKIGKEEDLIIKIKRGKQHKDDCTCYDYWDEESDPPPSCVLYCDISVV